MANHSTSEPPALTCVECEANLAREKASGDLWMIAASAAERERDALAARVVVLEKQADITTQLWDYIDVGGRHDKLDWDTVRFVLKTGQSSAAFHAARAERLTELLAAYRKKRANDGGGPSTVKPRTWDAHEHRLADEEIERLEAAAALAKEADDDAR